jgi:hypothetical protein
MKPKNPKIMIISLLGIMIILVCVIGIIDRVSVSQSQLLYGNIVVIAISAFLLLTFMRSLAQHYFVAYILLVTPIYQIFLMWSYDISAWWYLIALYSYTGVLIPRGTYEIKPVKHNVTKPAKHNVTKPVKLNLSKKLVSWYEERASKIWFF